MQVEFVASRILPAAQAPHDRLGHARAPPVEFLAGFDAKFCGVERASGKTASASQSHALARPRCASSGICA